MAWILAACSFNSGGFTPADDDDVDASAPGAPDAAAGTSDAAPGTPDAPPGTPDAAPTPDAPVPPPDAAPPADAASIVLVFRQGLAGYEGTRDTYIHETDGVLTNHAEEPEFGWDTVSGASPSGQNIGLLRFDDIFGGGADQIPVGASIVAATVELVVVDEGVAPAGALHESNIDWTETVTWDLFGTFPGVQSSELGAFVDSLPVAAGAALLDVTASLQAWASDPDANHGWIFMPDNQDGVDVASSEAGEPAERPTLTVEFFAP